MPLLSISGSDQQLPSSKRAASSRYGAQLGCSCRFSATTRFACHTAAPQLPTMPISVGDSRTFFQLFHNLIKFYQPIGQVPLDMPHPATHLIRLHTGHVQPPRQQRPQRDTAFQPHRARFPDEAP